MIVIQTKATVGPNRTLKVQLPDSLPVGEYDAVLVIDAVREATPQADLRDFPVDDYGTLLTDISLRREEMY